MPGPRNHRLDRPASKLLSQRLNVGFVVRLDLQPDLVHGGSQHVSVSRLRPGEHTVASRAALAEAGGTVAYARPVLVLVTILALHNDAMTAVLEGTLPVFSQR